ncbi:hypothetical protein HXX76_002976 [Chlamydomonas incerta]|uniref:Uncharacterized protein n=1 Tax=Chlamydomonas incerta TaxID=51695 RepID=A0A835W7Z8_CHLIN|nr:hypothetical protein HXX76_002976 [Chlamydomonas incerta]|eukprot:KAG2442900.1 hypothetical protein HXX76_002976 [Chlamydomonas incerta]
MAEGGCPFGGELVAAAAEGGSLEVLQLTLTERSRMHKWVEAAAMGACAGGQLGVLQQAHSYNPGTPEAAGAARAGQVAMLEHLLPLLAAKDAPGDARLRAREREGAPRWRAARLLVAITAGCPVEMLQRHYDRLWCCGAGQAAGSRQQDNDMDSERDMTASSLLAAAVDSPTPCWSAKLDFLLSRWGPQMAQEMLRGEREGIASDDGMRLGADMAEHAACWGQAEALHFPMSEAGARPNLRKVFDRAVYSSRRHGSPGHVAVLRLLRERGLALAPGDVVRASWGRATPERIQWLADVVDGMRGRGELDDEGARRLWTRVFTAAAATGASLPALQQLQALGAAIDLRAVADGGIQEVLAWAAAQLESAGELQAGTRFVGWYSNTGSDIGTFLWLAARGLQSLDDWLDGATDQSHVMRPTTFWVTQLWIQMRLQLPAVGPAAAAAAAAAVMRVQPTELGRTAAGQSASEVLVELIRRSQEPGRALPHQRAWLVRCKAALESAAAVAAT